MYNHVQEYMYYHSIFIHITRIIRIVVWLLFLKLHIFLCFFIIHNVHVNQSVPLFLVQHPYKLQQRYAVHCKIFVHVWWRQHKMEILTIILYTALQSDMFLFHIFFKNVLSEMLYMYIC